MNEHSGYEPTREDVLIGRVVDHEATPADWSALDELAHADPGLWARLGRAQRAHAGLRIAVEDAIAGAELVEIPEGVVHGAGRRSAAQRLTAVAGWGLAALLALAMISPALTGTTPASATQTAGFPVADLPTLLSQASTDQAYERYVASGLADGRVISEMPALVIDQQVLPDGSGTDVFIVRRVIERMRFNEVGTYRFAPDEHGTPRATPVTPPTSPIDTVPASGDDALRF